MKTLRLPRWKDCAVFGIVGLTAIILLLLSQGPHSSGWFAVRWGGLTAVLVVSTFFRQRYGK
ncbi:hypothetical protein [Paraburkholderia youngii]|uniref:hypothetical protein n=1 Tax=Paraburkholderia youngii TaxID=2782701 RepID=UPI003D20E8D2